MPDFRSEILAANVLTNPEAVAERLSQEPVADRLLRLAEVMCMLDDYGRKVLKTALHDRRSPWWPNIITNYPDIPQLTKPRPMLKSEL